MADRGTIRFDFEPAEEGGRIVGRIAWEGRSFDFTGWLDLLSVLEVIGTVHGPPVGAGADGIEGNPPSRPDGALRP